jgi:hypothetical protein
MLSMIILVLRFMAAASLSHTFWQEVEMMMESNKVPPYLQDALTHATFEQLDLDHDGVATQPEMQEYLAKLTADSADLLEAVKDIPLKYPVFQVTSTMSPEAKDAMCMMALAFEEIDFDSALEKYTTDNAFAESVESVFETAPMSVDYDVWHGIGQKEFLPQVYSDELVIPDECLAVRRKLLGPPAIAGAFAVGVFTSWAIWEVIAITMAVLGAAAETLLIECLDKQWAWDPSRDNCNWGHWSQATVIALLGEHMIVAAPYAFTAMMGASPEAAAAGGTGARVAGRAIGVPSGMTEGFLPPALIAGASGSEAVTACPAVETNVDYPGDNLDAGGWLGRVPGHLTRQQCAVWCKSDSRCAGYVFVKSQTSGDNCAVKSSWNGASRKPGSDCCDSQQINRGCISVHACPAVQTNVDYPSNDLNAGGWMGRVPGHFTREGCEAWCKADSRCVGYTFVKSETSRDNCAPKSSWVEGSRQTSSCCDSQQITRGVLSGCI